MDGVVESPSHPREAFRRGEGIDLQSEVAFFLLLGILFGPGREQLASDLNSIREEFPLPDSKPGAKFETPTYLRDFRHRYDLSPTDIRSLSSPESSDRAGRRRAIAADLVSSLYNDPASEIAADLTLLGLGDSNQFIRAAAAISFLDLFSELSLAIEALLSVIDESTDPLAGQIAEVALHRFGLRNRGAERVVPPSDEITSVAGQNSTVMIHGSHFGFVGWPIGTWWRPGGDFHTYIRTNYRPNLYSRPDHFTWSGGWSDHARSLAATELLTWSRNRNLANFDVLAHSHGGNVAMWATQRGLDLNKLVLLSCPVHMKHYKPNFSRVKEILSFQIKLDWVILADRGGTYFNHPRIKDHVLPKWFISHNDTHSPEFWQKHGLAI